MGKKFKWLTGSLAEAERWHTCLKRNTLVVLRHASNMYSFGQLVGKGNYAKVHIATHKVTGEKFAIKSINKKKAGSNERTLVFNLLSPSR